jgi:2,5-diketo-D-gluconate reductase A
MVLLMGRDIETVPGQFLPVSQRDKTRLRRGSGFTPTGNTDRIFVVGSGMTVPALPLNDGTTIPQLGFGVYQIPPKDTAKAVTAALEVGYRHIDTAQMYRNEKGVGDALAASGLARDEVYVTSKLNNGFHRPEDARREFERSLTALGTDHVDLFLIHWPLPTRYDGDFVSTWKTLIEFQADGRARSIGVSNFQPAHLDRLAEETPVVPAVNQIEVHPYFGNEEVRGADTKAGILTEAWSPIAQGDVLDDPVITRIARRLDRTPSQVVLRWHVQRGDIVFPKTTHVDRMRENFALFDFELTDADVAEISELDRGEAGRRGPNPDEFDWIP